MKKRVLCLGLICIFAIIASTSYSAYANANEMNLVNESNGVEVDVYQSSGEKGYVNIPKADNSVEVNNYSASISTGTGKFSFSLDEDREIYKSLNDDFFKIRKINEDEIIIKNEVNFTGENNEIVSTSYSINLPEGGYIDFTYDKEGNHTQSIVVYDYNDVAIGGFFDLEAISNSGKEFKSWFTIENNKLIQNIINTDTNANEVNVTMKAASLDYWHFYKSSKWIHRPTSDFPMALSIETNPYAQWDSFQSIAWKVLADRHRNDGITLQGIFRPYFQGNENGLYNQWLCHAMTVGHFKTWNLEPGRPNPGLAGTISAACNPY
ncbi:MAG: DUF2599 domain-containing protein [Clostridium sp.]